ncbi:PKD domain-containing protein [Maribellus sp. YY47]|uniref:PKD domain-containing protein n=1 Tax=Maribellus sp. YY47 TaxID=2929486 RepID=UPI0020017F9E|nr:PKD domain-containing protein [Maribellus sp. YY47]MCK3683234.1 PKD domain-containing protein [Maribellus sp. YY47]
MKKLLLLNLMLLVISWTINAQTATPPALGDGTESNPYQIATLENLYWLATNTYSSMGYNYYIQMADIDASSTVNWTDGWIPIGNSKNQFWGNYDGMNHVISGLYIKSSSNAEIGLFGFTQTAEFKNLGITNVYIQADSAENTGALLGYADFNVIVDNCFSTGTVKGHYYTGGLAGHLKNYNSKTTLRNSYSTCNVSGDSDTGGLVGICETYVSILNCFHSEGIVECNVGCGGLIGNAIDATISKCYSTGKVIGNSRVGGLVGIDAGSTIYNSYSKCPVTSNSTFQSCGGLVGFTVGNAKITNSYSTGSVLPGMGGLVGGFIPDYGIPTITSSFWDIETSGTESSAGDGEGITTDKMKTQSTFTDAGWDFTTFWGISRSCNEGYPFLNPEILRLPSVNIICNVSGEICSSINPIFTATPDNIGEDLVSYSWKLNDKSIVQDHNQYYLSELVPGNTYVVSCEITVSNTTNCTSTTAKSNEITLYVTDKPDAGEISGKNVIPVGGSTLLSSTVTGGFWLSAYDTIATVDEYGKVTGTGIGETSIGYIVLGEDPCNEIGLAEFLITVTAPSDNTPPYVSDIIPSTLDPIAINELFSITVSYSDDDGNVETAVIDWGDGSTTNMLSPLIDETYSYTYSNPGVYTITVSVDDGYGPVTKTYQYVVVYDPSAGFVTGGGWIVSPICVNLDPAYDYMDVSGTANFGFVAKYQKGKVTPDGNTEFQFKAGGLNFKSTDYEWLIIAGSKAQYKGSGTINGSGDFGFMLSAIDADLAENTETDLFRIKIWDKNNGDAVVYDNQCGADDYADLDQTTSIAGGSIVIHSADNKTKSATIQIDFDKPELTVYPNPFSDKLNFEFVSPLDTHVRIDLYDLTGRLIQTVFNNQVEAEIKYTTDFIPGNTVTNMYVYRMTMGETVFNGKVFYKR